MRLRHLILPPVLLLAISSAYAQNRGEVPLFRANYDGKVSDYSISEIRAEKLPKWDPTQPVIPLPIHSAVAKAQVWVKTLNPKFDSFVPARIGLGCVCYGKFSGLWYYTISLDGIVGGKRMHGPDFGAVVLMDGSIVEPREKKE
jgi:hypothetical protein